MVGAEVRGLLFLGLNTKSVEHQPDVTTLPALYMWSAVDCSMDFIRQYSLTRTGDA